MFNEDVYDHYYWKATTEERELFCKKLQAYVRRICQCKELNFLHLGPIKVTNNNSDVSLAYETNNKQLVVIKRIMHEKGDYKIPIGAYFEIITHLRLGTHNHKHLLHLLSLRITQKCTDFILPYYPITFYQLFVEKHAPPIEFIELKARELIQAVKQLHSCNIPHRDIKSANIVFDMNTTLILIDYDGCAPYRKRSSLPVITLHTRPPELIRLELASDKKHSIYDSFACDWWSVGCVIAEMYLEETLFEATEDTKIDVFLMHQEDILDRLHSYHGYSKLKRKMPSNMYEILKGLLQDDPIKRMQFIDVIEEVLNGV